MRRSLSRTHAVSALLATTLLAGALGPTPVHALQLEEQTDGAPLEILSGFTLIDGQGGSPLEDAAIAIRGYLIEAVGTRTELHAQWASDPNVIRVDLGGGYVVPGLIDSHVHLATAPNRRRAEASLRRLLYSGVTAVRDMAGDGRALASLARDSRVGEIVAPDIYYSALMAGPSFLSDPRPRASAAGETPGEVPWMHAITPETDMVQAVAAAKGTFAQGIKIYANLEPAEVGRITYEAQRQGMRVWSHSMVFPTRPLEVVRAGADVVSHVCRISWEAMADAPDRYDHGRTPDFEAMSPDSPVFTELFEEMVARGTILDATIGMRRMLDEQSAAAGRRVGPPDCDTDFDRALTRRAHEMGVAIIAGTDFNTPPSDPYPALHIELEELVEHAGLTPSEAIVAATSTAARALGVDDEIGTLSPGKHVNFVLLEENPLEDISHLRTVKEVWKNAHRFARQDYVPPVVASSASDGAAIDTSTPRAVLDSWVRMWSRYDLDWLDDLFLTDDRLTYFSSEFEGVIEGFAAIIPHHQGFGFVSGGTEPSAELWVEDAVIRDFGETAIIGGVWFFGDRLAREEAGKGPMTIVLTRTEDGYRISHMHFANYEGGS